MSTTPIDTWAVDLADVTTIYPFVGFEAAMAAFAIVLWIGWHVWQVKHESETYANEIQKYGTSEHISIALDRD